MKRTLLGNLFGQAGMYVSQPGDDLDDPQKSLILDSRFSQLEIHVSGIQNLNRTGPINNAYTFLGTANFPSLGYTPISYVSLIDRGSDVVSYPLGTPINGRNANFFEAVTTQNSIRVSYTIEGGQGAFNASFAYVIFKRTI